MSRRSKVKIYPLLKRREPSRNRMLPGSRQNDLMSVSLTRRKEVSSRAKGDKCQIEFFELIPGKSSESQDGPSRALFIPRLVRR